MARFVNRRLIVMDRAHQGKAIGSFCQARGGVAEVHSGSARLNGAEGTANLGRRAGLEVESIEVSGTADEEKDNAIEVARGIRPRLGKLGECQADRTRGESAGSQKVAAAQAVAEFHTLFVLEL